MTTKPDLSREWIEHLASYLDSGDLFTEGEYGTIAATLRTLLAAKEAAEAAHREAYTKYCEMRHENHRLRAERGTAWLAGRDAAAASIRDGFKDANQERLGKSLAAALISLTPPADDAAALEALIREGKAEAWGEGWKARGLDEAYHDMDFGKDYAANPYRAKENG